MGILYKIYNKDIRFFDLKFVLKARLQGKDNFKPFFRCIKIEDEKIIGTDSRRMHIITIKDHGFQPGIYEILVNQKNEIIMHESSDGFTWPKWELIIPKDYKKRNTTKYTDDISGPIQLFRILPEQIGIKFYYLQDLDRYNSWTVYIPKALEPVIFESDKKMAVIMPFKVKETAN